MRSCISVIIPCYNLEKTVGRMLDSVLKQTYPNIELIVVNDGSTDNSEAVILSYEERFKNSDRAFKYVKQENSGLGAAINAGLREITGEYFCWGDADDYYEPTSFEERAAVLESRPELAVVTSNAYIRGADKLNETRLLAKNNAINNDPEQFLYHLNGDSIFCSGCHMVRTSMFREVYPDMQIYPARRGQNWQLLLPLYFKYKRYFLNKPLYNYIVYPNSMSKDRDCQEDKIRRFNEHEKILNEVLKHIAKTENVDITEYSRFLDDKYAKLRMEVYLKYGDYESFKQEYIKKQHNVGIDKYDRIALLRYKSRLFRSTYRIAYRIAHGGGTRRDS